MSVEVGTNELPTESLWFVCWYLIGTSNYLFPQIQTIPLSHTNRNGREVPAEYLRAYGGGASEGAEEERSARIDRGDVSTPEGRMAA
jgi:hypothetical protein